MIYRLGIFMANTYYLVIYQLGLFIAKFYFTDFYAII